VAHPSTCTPRAGLAANLLLSLVVLVLLVGVGECLARWLEPPATQRLAEEEIEAAPELAPDELYLMRSHSPGWPPSDRFNRDGVRDRPWPEEKLPGVRRVVCLGDSVTYGPDAEASEAYPQTLGRLLAARGPWAEVLNVSLWGWSTFHERLAYERIARRYRPDLVLLGVCLNDLPDLLALRPPPLLVALHRRSALLRWLIGAEARQAHAVEDLFGETPGAAVAYARFAEELACLRRETDADGAGLALVVFPIRPQLSGAPPPPRPQQRLRAIAERAGLGFLDLREALAPLGEAAFLPGDGLHLTGDGCRRVAEAVRDSGLLPGELAGPRALVAALGGRAPDAVGGEALAERLADAETAVRAEAAWALGHVASGVDSGAPGAAESPAGFGPRAALVERLGDAEPAVRAVAARSLAPVAARSDAGARAEAVAALLPLLDDAHEAVRWSAADAIHELQPHDPELAPALTRLTRSGDVYVRAFALWTLADLPQAASEAVPAVVRAVDDPDPGVRALAARVLGRIGTGHPAAVAALVDQLGAADWDTRWRAARSLGRIGASAEQATPRLQSVARDDASRRVREEAARALRRIRSNAPSR
jgi:HEAT repeat protein